MEIKQTILGAFAYVYLYHRQLAKAVMLPVSGIVLEGLVSSQDQTSPLMALLSLISIIFYIHIAVTTHRIILLGPDSVPEWGIYLPRKRELMFFLYSLAICLITVPFGFLMFIPFAGWLLAIAAMWYLVARLSLVFPAIATDQNWSFADSWRATKNYQLLMVVVGIFPFAVSVPEQLLSHIPYMDLFVNLVSACTLVLIVAALSVAFQRITVKANALGMGL